MSPHPPQYRHRGQTVWTDNRVRTLVASLALLGCFLSEQTQPSTSGPAASDATLEQRLAAYRHLLSDWAGLTRYGSEDSEVPPPAPGEQRVVFLGDEITEVWGQGRTTFFPGKPYFNRGISGQTTAQMLVRFRQDVIALKPRAVVIEGGTNDLASLFGPGTEGTMFDNIKSMTELAKANGIRVVLASITPVCDCVIDQTTRRPQGKIVGSNGSMREYAARSGAVYLNYYAALADGRDFKRALTVDGLLPNDAGYAVMGPLAEQAIAQALGMK
jgi:lysophospholipase L1-like esterase